MNLFRKMSAALCAAAAATLIGPGAASADPGSTCGLPDADRVVWCSDGSHQYVDDRGHLLIIDRFGNLRLDLPPNTAWY